MIIKFWIGVALFIIGMISIVLFSYGEIQVKEYNTLDESTGQYVTKYREISTANIQIPIFSLSFAIGAICCGCGWIDSWYGSKFI